MYTLAVFVNSSLIWKKKWWNVVCYMCGSYTNFELWLLFSIHVCWCCTVCINTWINPFISSVYCFFSLLIVLYFIYTHTKSVWCIGDTICILYISIIYTCDCPCVHIYVLYNSELQIVNGVALLLIHYVIKLQLNFKFWILNFEKCEYGLRHVFWK